MTPPLLWPRAWMHTACPGHALRVPDRSPSSCSAHMSSSPCLAAPPGFPPLSCATPPPPELSRMPMVVASSRTPWPRPHVLYLLQHTRPSFSPCHSAPHAFHPSPCSMP